MKLLIKIFSPIFLLSSLLFFCYVFFQSEINKEGNFREYYLIYYFISIALITLSIVTFFANKILKKYIFISIISLIVALYLFESYITFAKGSYKEYLYNNQTGRKFDTRSKIEFYYYLKKNNKTALIVSLENYLDRYKLKDSIFPLSGISNSKTINCNENGYYSIYDSDRFGFNNPDDEWDAGEIEYLLVGDSFAHGSCVNGPNDIGSVLRTLSNKSLLNLGFAGTGPLMQYATLREYISLNVKKVLWIYYEGNDLNNLKHELENNTLNKYLTDLNFTQKLKFKQNQIDELIENILEKNLINYEKSIETAKHNIFIHNIKGFFKLHNTRALIIRPGIHKSQKSSSIPGIEFKKILQQTKDLVNHYNAKLYFVYLPEYNRYKYDYDNSNYNFIKKTIKELEIEFIDVMKEVFENEENPLSLFPFKLDDHYNEQGYRKVSTKLFNYTKN